MVEIVNSAAGGKAVPSTLRLLELARQARHANTGPELQFLLVNQSHNLCPYLIGVLWVAADGVVAQSGVSRVERNAPFVQWLSGVCAHLEGQKSPIKITSDVLTPEQLETWSNHLPASAVWFPVADEGQLSGGLLLCRQEAWEEVDIALLTEWLDIWSHAWKKLYAPSLQSEFKRVLAQTSAWIPSLQQIVSDWQAIKFGGRYVWVHMIKRPSRWPFLASDALRALMTPISILVHQGPKGLVFSSRGLIRSIWQDKARLWRWSLGLLLVLPVRLTVLAPAELVPAKPAIIRVPIEGVLDEFFVAPNQAVTEGQLLFRLDLTTLTSRLNVARQEIQIAASEYRQSALQSLTDSKSRTQLITQEAKAAERKVEADYLKDLLSKAQIKAPRSGVVLFDDPSEWIGKPVAAGEKVMVVASVGDVEIEAWLPIGDAIELEQNAALTLYLNASPLRPVDGLVRYVGHEASQRPDGSYAYRVRARLRQGELGARVGLRGTAKISGQYVPLIYWIVRKPLSSIRQFFGI